jgi:flagellar M-ring protein FliF
VMTNVSFNSNAPEVKLAPMAKVLEEAKSMLHTEPALIRTGVMGLIALGVVLFVLRPVTKQVTAALKAPVLLASGGPEAEGAEGLQTPLDELGAPIDPSAPKLSANPALLARKRLLKHGQALFEHVSEQIGKEPVQSTRLLEGWINTTEQERD